MTTNLFTLYRGDCIETMRFWLPDNSVDAIVTDPPYGLGAEPDALAMLSDWITTGHHDVKSKRGFMGKEWDAFVPQPAVWRECMRVLKPGGYLLSFAGTRTHDLVTLGLRIAGFEVRDTIMWVYGSGFPKSLDVSKAIDKAAGAEREFTPVGSPVKRLIPGAAQNATGSWIKDNGREYQPGVSEPATDAARQWQGWGTALKPALEPITVARKPLAGTVVENVLAWGTGAINVDGCRVGDFQNTTPPGRWPANLIHDGSDEVLALFPANAGAAAPVKGTEASAASVGRVTGERERVPGAFHADAGSAARFFYCAKASRADRGEGNHHPTVKPTDLMRYLCRLVTPRGAVVLDPFMGSGSTGKAAMLEGFQFIGIDDDPESFLVAQARINAAVK